MPPIRVFVSIPVPDTAELEDLRRTLASAGVRPSPPEQTHLTLSFIGDVDESKVKRITECVRRAAEGFRPMEIILSGLGAFPNERRPSVVWTGVSPAGPLKAMAAKLEKNLAAAGIPHDGKPFKAHVTVARTRDSFVPPTVFEGTERKVYCRFVCYEVLVMKSVLGPGGAKHSVLSRIPLSD